MLLLPVMPWLRHDMMTLDVIRRQDRCLFGDFRSIREAQAKVGSLKHPLFAKVLVLVVHRHYYRTTSHRLAEGTVSPLGAVGRYSSMRARVP